MANNKLKKGEKWADCLSDCCEAPIKEVGKGVTMLVCSDCNDICSPMHPAGEEDYEDNDFDGDFYEEDDDF